MKKRKGIQSIGRMTLPRALRSPICFVMSYFILVGEREKKLDLHENTGNVRNVRVLGSFVSGRLSWERGSEMGKKSWGLNDWCVHPLQYFWDPRSVETSEFRIVTHFPKRMFSLSSIFFGEPDIGKKNRKFRTSYCHRIGVLRNFATLFLQIGELPKIERGTFVARFTWQDQGCFH